MDTIKIGKFLAELRKEQNLTQEQLGEKLGVTNKTVSRWENGNYLPPAEMLQLLSELYGISINEILSGQRLAETAYKEKAEENIKSALESSFTLKEKIDFYKKKWLKEHRLSTFICFGIYILLIVFGIHQDNRGLHLLAFAFMFVFIILRYNMMMAYVERRAFDPPLYDENAENIDPPDNIIWKRIRVTALVILAICIWITTDLTINYFASLVPEINDGITIRGIWSQLFFGIDGYRWSVLNYYKGFETSLKVTGFIGILNIILACEDLERINRKARG